MAFASKHIDKSFIGAGGVYLRERGGDNPLLLLGNTSELSIAYDEEKQELRNFMSPGGGNVNTLTVITNFTFSLLVHDYSAETLAISLRASATAVAAGTVTDEVHQCVGTDGELIPFDFPIDHTAAITVKTAGDVALVVDTDYLITSTGIIVNGDGDIDNTGVKVSYTKHPGVILEALVAGGKEYEIVLDGVNVAQSETPNSVRLFRSKFSPTSGLSFLGTEFGEISLEGDVLSAPEVTGSGLSKYMRVALGLPSAS